MILGCISVGLGAAGVVIPVLPTVPFLMFAAFCFAGSSKKLDRWFKNTKLYKENLADFAAGRGMTKQNKMPDHDERNVADECRFYYDGIERDRFRLRCAGRRVDLSFDIFPFSGEDDSGNGGA